MTPFELAVARRRAYHLFGRLFREGINAELLPLLNAIPELADAVGAIDLEQAAADHYHLTAVSVFPYESIFLDPSGLLGGMISDRLVEAYRQSGYETLSDADHIAYELLFLSHLCTAEAAALDDGNEDTAALWQKRQQTFLTTHLLFWLGPLVVATEQSGSDFYGRLANLTLDLAADHLAEAAANGPAVTLPTPPQLGSEESGLKDIARYLVTPPYSGNFLSRDAISTLARRHEIPRGFSDRAQMLTNLLRTAGQYDAAGAVFLDLAGICQKWADSYQEQYERLPKLRPWLRPWQERVNQTAESLFALTAALPDDTSN